MSCAACTARSAVRLRWPSSTPASVAASRADYTTRAVSRNRPKELQLGFLAPSWLSHRPISPPLSRSQYRATTIRPSSIPSRSLTTSRRQQARIVANPRTDDNGKEMVINITPRAAHRLQAIAEKDKNPELALRVSVESGGCHGFQYLMKLINMPEVDKEDDTIFENEDGSGDFRARVVMDEPSLELLKGSSIDYTMELIGSQFKVTGIPGAKSSCGCGTSFDIAE